MANEINKLRGILFNQLDRLTSNDNLKIIHKEVKRSASIVEVAKTIIDTGKLEISFLKTIENNKEINSKFFTEETETSITKKLKK